MTYVVTNHKKEYLDYYKKERSARWGRKSYLTFASKEEARDYAKALGLLNYKIKKEKR